jgi:PAS domain S-box-containing protein
MSFDVSKLNLSYSEFVGLIDELYDEVLIYDNNYTIVYINKACERHYGMTQEEMVGRSFWDFQDQYWNLSVLPHVYKEKKAFMQKQSTYMGSEILTIALPIFDQNGEIEYVVMSVRDDFSNVRLNYLYDVLTSDLAKQKDFDNLIVYKSEQMQAVIETIEQLKDIPSPCLILGETGVGKSLIGKYINAKSQKYNKTFVNLNCAAIHKDLIETELFGYAQGAFTGSKKEGKKGLLELADGGVLLLDEISELPFNLQAKLLQFIQDKEFYQVGAEKPVKVDVKIIAATNRNIKKMVEMSNFREDLYYRLNVFEIEIPPLRERKEDILAVTYFS